MDKAKPDVVSFFGIPWEIYCGACKRRIATAGKYWLYEDIKKDITKCKWCGKEIDWDGQSTSA